MRPMSARLPRPLLSAVFCLSVISGGAAGLSGCNSEEKSSAAATGTTPQSAEAKKKETVDALLRANGIDPTTIPTDDKAPPVALPDGADANGKAQAAPAAEAQGTGLRDRVEIVSAGAAPRKKIRYVFEKDRTKNFSVEMLISPKETVNGQPVPSTPPVQLTMAGTSKTMAVNGDTAARQNIFSAFAVKAEGLPPELIEQQKAQVEALKGLVLLETVHDSGQVIDLQVGQESANNPQVLAILQNLQDAMTNAYLALPVEEVGAGAKWKITSETDTAGIRVTRVTEVTLNSLVGNKAKVSLSLSQTAPAQKLEAPGLPPGAVVELLGIKGTGTGTMTVDFATLETDRKGEMMMSVSQRITGAQPEPVLTSSDTGLKLHIRVTP